jgi:hypothetical protein
MGKSMHRITIFAALSSFFQNATIRIPKFAVNSGWHSGLYRDKGTDDEQKEKSRFIAYIAFCLWMVNFALGATAVSDWAKPLVSDAGNVYHILPDALSESGFTENITRRDFCAWRFKPWNTFLPTSAWRSRQKSRRPRSRIPTSRS